MFGVMTDLQLHCYCSYYPQAVLANLMLLTIFEIVPYWYSFPL